MKNSIRAFISALFFIGLLAISLLFLELALPQVSPLRKLLPAAVQNESPALVSDHGHEELHSLMLSEQALRNIGITDDVVRAITVTTYDKTVSFPAMLTGRPGRSTFRVPVSFAGIVKKIYVEPGMVVQPGQPLFDIDLAHEELLRCQTELISLCQKRDTVQKELDRLESLTTELAPKAKRDAAIQKNEIDVEISTQRNVLLIHGIPEKEILETIEGKRSLVKTVTVHVPKEELCDCESKQNGEKEHVHEHLNIVIQMEELFVDKGQLVNMGDPLCQLVDLSLLNIEGRASSNDENILATALMEHCNVTALFDGERVEGLRIRYIDTRIDPVSRALRFYVELSNNVVVRDAEHSHNHPWKSDNGADQCEIHRHYVNWRFRPGQRCELKVEYDTIDDCIVLPREAVAESGSEAFVFEWTGTEPEGEKRRIWTKRPIHILHRGKSQVAVANDGSVFPGAQIATRGAGQLLVALTSGSGQLQSTCPCGDH